MDPEYKKLHEQFVSNSTGTTPEEIVLISCSIPLSVLIIAFTLKASNFKLNQTSFGFVNNLYQVLNASTTLKNGRKVGDKS